MQQSLEKLPWPMRHPAIATDGGQKAGLGASSALELGVLVRLAGWRLPDREKLWKVRRDIGTRLRDDTFNRETLVETLPDDKSAVGQERDLAQVRARLSAALLRHAGVADTRVIEDVLVRVNRA